MGVEAESMKHNHQTNGDHSNETRVIAKLCSTISTAEIKLVVVNPKKLFVLTNTEHITQKDQKCK